MKILLAYSGGLDTSVILKWLINKGHEITCYVADVGQEEDFEAIKEKAKKIGAKEVIVEDLKEELITDYLFEAIKANTIYEYKYLLGTAIARPIIAKKMIETAKKLGITTVAHGCTGKGNDQVRFEIAFYQLMPEITIISPWKDEEFLKQFQGRKDLIEYAKKEGIPITSTLKKPYSIDENIIHTSYESGILENPATPPKEEMFKKTKSPQEAPDEEEKITIHFQKGIPVKVTNHETGEEIIGALNIVEYLNKIGGEHGIGREDLVESRFVGMKSRGVYETPGTTILIKAHQDLEGITLDKEVIMLKQLLSQKMAQAIYNGFWFSPEMKMIMAAINQSQERVNGIVNITLYKGNTIITGRESPTGLYDEEIASMDVHGGYDQKDAEGFIKLQALRLIKSQEQEAKLKEEEENDAMG